MDDCGSLFILCILYMLRISIPNRGGGGHQIFCPPLPPPPLPKVGGHVPPLSSVRRVPSMITEICSSIVERPLMVRWVVGSIPFGGPIELFFSFHPFHNWCNKGHGMAFHVCGMMHINDPLLVMGKSIPWSGSREHLPYVLRHITLNIKMCLMRR